MQVQLKVTQTSKSIQSKQSESVVRQDVSLPFVPQTYLSTSFSLTLGSCCVPDSSVCRRPTLFMAEESGEAETAFWMYFLPVSGVETFRAEA